MLDVVGRRRAFDSRRGDQQLAAAHRALRLGLGSGVHHSTRRRHVRGRQLLAEDDGAVRSASLADALHSELVQEEVLPALLTMASDPVPNIRFNVAKTLEKLAPRVGPEVVSAEIAPCLSHLVETDADRDVKYFARCALRTIAA